MCRLRLNVVERATTNTMLTQPSRFLSFCLRKRTTKPIQIPDCGCQPYPTRPVCKKNHVSCEEDCFLMFWFQPHNSRMTKFIVKSLLILALLSASWWQVVARASSIHPPYDIETFQPLLEECRLQCPSTSKPVVSNGQFANITVPGHFYARYDTVVFAMDSRYGKRCELRHNKEWSTADRSIWYRIKAIVQVIPDNDKAFTFMQIHSKSFTGTNGKKYRKGPPLMIGRGTRGDLKDRLWAYVRVGLEPKKVIAYDLGPRPDYIFDLEVMIGIGIISIRVNGKLVCRTWVNEWDVLPRNYLKAGMYVHGPGQQVVEYRMLKFEVIDNEIKRPTTNEPTTQLTIAPTQVPTSLPTSLPTSSPVVEPYLGLRVTKFVLMDAESNTKLFDLVDGHIMDKRRLPKFSIQAIVENGPPEVVAFFVDGKLVKREKHAPYSIAGDSSGGNYKPWSIDDGLHTITATPYGRRKLRHNGHSSGTEMEDGSLTITIRLMGGGRTSSAESYRVAPKEELPRVVDMALVDTNTGDDLFVLSNGAVVDRSARPAISVRADTNPGQVGSVVFFVNSKIVKMENFGPYSIAGEGRGRRYNPWNINRGVYNLTSVAYTAKNGRGTQGVSLTTMIIVL